MPTNSNLLSLNLLHVVQANGINPEYPLDCFLREAQVALRVSVMDLAFFLGVGQKQLESWMYSGDSSAVPLYVVRGVNWILAEAARATECSMRPDGHFAFPEENWTPRPREAFEDEPPAWLGIGVDPAIYNEISDDSAQTGGASDASL